MHPLSGRHRVVSSRGMIVDCIATPIQRATNANVSPVQGASVDPAGRLSASGEATTTH